MLSANTVLILRTSTESTITFEFEPFGPAHRTVSSTGAIPMFGHEACIHGQLGVVLSIRGMSSACGCIAVGYRLLQHASLTSEYFHGYLSNIGSICNIGCSESWVAVRGIFYSVLSTDHSDSCSICNNFQGCRTE